MRAQQVVLPLASRKNIDALGLDMEREREQRRKKVPYEMRALIADAAEIIQSKTVAILRGLP